VDSVFANAFHSTSCSLKFDRDECVGAATTITIIIITANTREEIQREMKLQLQLLLLFTLD